MKLLPLMLLVVCCSASAEWIQTCSTDFDDKFLDAETIERIGKNRRVWVVHNFREVDNSKGLPVASLVDFVEYSCQQRQAKTLQQSWHAEKWGKGKVLTPGRLNGVGEWEFLPPGSCGEKIMKDVCSK